MPSPVPAAVHALPPSWLGVEHRHLSALRALSEYGTFRGAALALGYSQSGMSQLVTQLERMLGLTLVERHPGAPVTLTRHGEVLLSHANAILHSFAAAQADLASLERPRLRIGILASLAPQVLSAVLEAAEIAEIIEVEDDSSLASLVTDGGVEIAIGEIPPSTGPFDVRRLTRDSQVLAVPAAWRHAEVSEYASAELLGRLPLIARPGSATADRLSRQLHARGITPVWAARAPSDAAALALVRTGCGAAIVPGGSVAPWDDLVFTVALDDLLPARTICRYVHRDRRLPHGVGAIADAVAAALSTPNQGPVSVS